MSQSGLALELTIRPVNLSGKRSSGYEQGEDALIVF